MHIALASQEDLPAWEVDDAPLHCALLKRGHTLTLPAWTDPQVDWRTFDAVLLRYTWNYAGQRERFVAWAEATGARTALFHGAEVVRWNTDKRYLRDLGERGVHTVPTLWLESGDRIDLRTVLAERGWSRGFIKPVFGQTARETLRFDATQEGLRLANTHISRLLPHEPLMLQPYLESVEAHGERSAIVIDGRITHAVEKRPAAGDYRVQDDWGGTDALTTRTPPEEALVAATLTACPFPLLYGRIDFLSDADGRPALIELEVVEPSLFFRHAPATAEFLADALEARMAASTT